MDPRMVTPLQIKTLGLKSSSMDGEDLGTDDGKDAHEDHSLVIGHGGTPSEIVGSAHEFRVDMKVKVFVLQQCHYQVQINVFILSQLF